MSRNLRSVAISRQAGRETARGYLVRSILLLFLANPIAASAENALSRIAEALKQPSEQTQATAELQVLPDQQQVHVVIIDGIHLGASLFNRTSERRFTDSYLQDAANSWGIASSVEHIGWSGNFDATPDDLLTIKNGLATAYGRAKKEGRKLVIVAHSWGSVLAYRALRELHAAKKLPNDAVFALTTIGSPLNRAENPRVSKFTSNQVTGPKAGADQAIQSAVDEHANWAGPSALKDVVGTWNNYWLPRDTISGPIETNGKNQKLLHIGFGAHQAYYKNPALSQQIGRDLFSLLASAEGSSMTTTNRTDATSATTGPSTRTASSPEGLDIVGVHIGDTATAAIAALRESYPGMTFNQRASKVRPMENAHPPFALTEKMYCADNTPKCVRTIRATHMKGAFERVIVEIRLIENYPNHPGSSIVYYMTFTHEFGSKGKYFDPQKAAERKYGEPNACSRLGMQQRTPPVRGVCPSGSRGNFWVSKGDAKSAITLALNQQRRQYSLTLSGGVDIKTRNRAINAARQKSNETVNPF